MQSHCIHTICIAVFSPISILLYANDRVNGEGEGSVWEGGGEFVAALLMSIMLVYCELYVDLDIRYMGDMFWHGLLDLEISYCYFELYIYRDIRYIGYIFLYSLVFL